MNYDSDDMLVDIRSIKLRKDAPRVENALSFLKQIKNPHLFKVGNDTVELCFSDNSKVYSEVIIEHFKRMASS